MDLLIVLLLGIGISFVSSFTSGALGILSLAALLGLGLSPHVALGTLRVGSLGHSLGSLKKYLDAKKVVWDLVLPITILSILGAIIGSQLVISLDEQLLEQFIGWAILLFIPFSLIKPSLGTQIRIVNLRDRLIGHCCTFLISIWGASFVVGTGIFITYAQTHFYGRTILEVRGTNRLPNVIKTIVVLGIFGYYGLVDWQLGVVFGLGMLIGSYFGVHYAVKMGDSWLRYILLATIALFSLKLILGL